MNPHDYQRAIYCYITQRRALDGEIVLDDGAGAVHTARCLKWEKEGCRMCAADTSEKGEQQEPQEFFE